MNTKGSHKLGRATLAMGIMTLSLLVCADAEAKKKPPPPPPPPPPPVVVAIPYRPIPPNGASPNFQPPMRGPDGLYVSVNRNITPAQTLWNLRSAYNVAALNCSRTEFPTIVDGYRSFLSRHAKALATANRNVDAEFRSRHGPRFVAPRERYMTEVYNHFALPMTVNDFCKAVLAVSYDAVLAAGTPAKPITQSELDAFAARSLPSIEIVFDDFYRRYEQWRVEVAAWDARYAPRPVTPAPALVISPAPTVQGPPRPATPAPAIVISPTPTVQGPPAPATTTTGRAQ